MAWIWFMHVLLAREANGDHDDQRCRANHHAQSGQSKPHLARAERVNRNAHDLTEEHRLARGFHQRTAGHSALYDCRLRSEGSLLFARIAVSDK